ncbi:MAG TPA: hypothetical protein VF821_18775 [Lentzea sp.]
MTTDGSRGAPGRPAGGPGRGLICSADDGPQRGIPLDGNAPQPPSSADDVPGGYSPPKGTPREQRSRTTRADVVRFIRAVRDSDEAVVDDTVMRLSRARPWLAPLTLTVGAFVMLFDGVKLVFTNWRLTLVQVLPAMWIWAAMYDLKLHVSPWHDKAFDVLTRPAVVISLVLAIAAITAAAFYLNAVFAYAIIQPGRPQIRPAFTRARSHLGVVLGSGFAVGVCLGLSTVVADRWGVFWFALTLGAVIGVMMISYVAVPSRLAGIKTTRSRGDKLTASVVGVTIGAVICTPPYILGRVGLLMLGTKVLFPLGVIFFAVGLTLMAGATGAVKAVRMSAKFVPGPDPAGKRSATLDNRHPSEGANGKGHPDMKSDDRPRVGRRVRHGIEAAEERYSGSAPEDLWHRLDALDFMNQAMLLAGTLLLCVFPFLIVLSALTGRGAAITFSRRLGLNQQAAADLGHLFTSSRTTSATISTASLVLLVLFLLAGASAVQQLYERIFDLDSRGARDLLRRLIWAGLVVGWGFLGGLVGPSVRAGGPVLTGVVILVAFTGFWWFAMRFLLGGRVPWRRLFPSAVATGLCWLGMVAVFSATFSGMVISSYDRYGPIGVVFDLLSYILAVGVVIILGAVVGIVWYERGLSFRAAFGKLRRAR